MMEIAEYLLVRRLGSGAMGSVWLAHNSKLETNCAIKLIHPDGDFDAGQALQRLMREGLAIAKLSHPNVVAVRDIIPLPEKQSAALVMDYFDGRQLSSLVPPPGLALPFERVARILIQCAAGLDHAHERGIIHRDVKPLYILADESDFVVIVDFGIAKSQGHKSQLTTGLAIGTPHYMAPEQINMGAVDGRTDQ